MAYNPRTYNLYRQTDISNALEKAERYLAENESSVVIKSDKPFSLAMRFGRYIKAFKEQMKNVEDVDERKYDTLMITHDDDQVKITHALEVDQLELFDEATGGKIEWTQKQNTTWRAIVIVI